MIKSFLMIAFFCLIAFKANAQDDRYFNSSASYAHKQIIKKQVKQRVAKRKSSIRPQKPAGLHFLADAAQAAVTPIRRIAGAISHAARPFGCPSRAWCGCFLSKHLSLHRRDLWLARNWARLGTAASPAPGTIVVWLHHVGRITAVDGHKIKVLSGNDGRRVRERWRTMAGVIAVRRI